MSKNKSKCTECSITLPDKKLLECHDCGQKFCKEHSRANDTEHIITCCQCFKKKIHLEVTLEMESETISAKNELESYKQKIKNSRKDLASKKSKIENCENQIKINKKTFERKLESLENKIEEEKKRKENLEKTSESLECSLSTYKESEEQAKSSMETTKSEYKLLKSELDEARLETNKLKIQIQSDTSESKKFIYYSEFRGLICEPCKHKVKKIFKTDIANGEENRLSIRESLARFKESVRPVNTKPRQEEKPCCFIS